MVLPFTILRRLDCVLADTKDAVLAEQEAKKDLNMLLKMLSELVYEELRR